VQENPKDWDLLIPFATLAFNSSVHSTTGVTPNELIIPASPHYPMAPTSLTTFEIPSRFTSPLAYRQQVLRVAEQLGKAARETNAERAQRYKMAYDAKVRETSHPISPVDFVYVRAFAPNRGKLLYPSTGPRLVEKRQGAVLTVRTPAGSMTINVDSCAAVPHEIPQEPSTTEVPEQPVQQEFVVDRIISHAVDPTDRLMKMRVRWHSFDPEDDTWEDPKTIPRHFVLSYAKRKRMKVSRFFQDVQDDDMQQ
jgi:hypothetical protein